MGNSQSIEKVTTVVQEGIKIYETVKKQQNQDQHQHYEQHYVQQQTSVHYHHSQDVDDDDQYSSLRQRAHEEAEKRNELYAASQAAYQSGDGAEGFIFIASILTHTYIHLYIAKQLSIQGHKHDERMKEFNRQAAEYIYASGYYHYKENNSI